MFGFNNGTSSELHLVRALRSSLRHRIENSDKLQQMKLKTSAKYKVWPQKSVPISKMYTKISCKHLINFKNLKKKKFEIALSMFDAQLKTLCYRFTN